MFQISIPVTVLIALLEDAANASDNANATALLMGITGYTPAPPPAATAAPRRPPLTTPAH